MKIQLKNKHIYFALGDIWEVLNYKLKFQINEKVTADSDLETVQEVEFTRSDLELVISSVNNKPQGMSREINPEMFMAVLPQVQKIVQDEIKDGWKLNEEKDNYTEEMYRDWETDRKSTRLNSSHRSVSRMPSSA